MATSTHPLVGTLVDGRYRVLRHVADGGMASVLVATDIRLDREVALKVMRGDLADDDTLVSRFRREARSAARLGHPNVVSVFDQGEHEGLVYLVMEYIEGRTVREVLDTEGALTPRAALDIIEPVLTGLAAAHDAGLIHRDVKPENVLIPDRGAIKVADFGLARAVTSRTTTANEGVLFGTVAYLSPEQVERGIADARSDVYAAGLLLFELLTGTTAITGETPIHVAFQHVHDGVPAPSSRLPGLPPRFDELVALATAIDPDQRPRDATDYLEAVRQVRQGLTPAELDGRPGGPGSGAPTVATPRPRADRTEALSAPHDAGSARGAGNRRVAGAARSHEDQSEAGRQRRRWPRQLLVLLVTAALLGGGGWWYATAGPGGHTTIPPVEGLSQDDASALFADHDLEVAAVEAFDEQVPDGIAIGTRPAEGTEVSKGEAITVTFSKGPERFSAPDLAGSTRDQASAALRADSLRLGKVTEAWDEEVAAGEVVSQDPSEGTRLKRDAQVAVVLSKGPQPIDVPVVTGSGFEGASATLEEAGFVVSRAEDVFSTTVDKGKVVSQDPASGTAFRGATVTVTVSKGPEMVDVPAVDGKTEAEARAALEAAGFQVKVQRFIGGLLDEVRAVSPSGGTSAIKGSTVTILVV